MFCAPPGPDDAAVLESAGSSAASYLLAVGSLDPRKNLPLLAQAYAALSDEERAAHPLVVVGGGAGIFRSEQISWPAEVVDAGYVSDDELRALYAGCRAVVFVSLAEGFGLPLVEAAAAGAGSLRHLRPRRCSAGSAARTPRTTSTRRPSTASPPVCGAWRSSSVPGVDLARFAWDDSARRVAELCQAVGSGTAVTPWSDSTAGSPVPAPARPHAGEDRSVSLHDVEPRAPRVAVVLASAGRPHAARPGSASVQRPDAVNPSPASCPFPTPRACPTTRSLLEGWAVVTGTRGLAAQRNAGMDAVPDADLVAFFDDDAVVRADYLARAVDFLGRAPRGRRAHGPRPRRRRGHRRDRRGGAPRP